MITVITNWWRKLLGQGAHKATPRRRRRSVLTLEALETRDMPSVGAPFAVSTSLLYDSQPATASSANGQSVVVWEKDDGQGDTNIFAQLFDFNHNKIGNAITVANTSDDEYRPDVAMDGKGNFVVVWTRDVNNSANFDVQLATFNHLGALVKTGGVLNTEVVEFQPQVAMSEAGTFAVTFTRQTDSGQSDILAQRFDAAASPLGAPIIVAGNPNFKEFDARIDMADNGRFAIAYRRDPADAELFLKRYFASGDLQSKTKIAGNLANGSIDVGITNTGRCAVVYIPFHAGDTDTNVYLRTLSAGGTLSAKQALTTDSDDESSPRIAMDHLTGEFVVVYNHEAADGDHVVVREFTKNGTAKEVEHDLGVKSASAAISMDGLDRYFVAYEYEYSDSDNDIKAVYGSL